MTITCIRINWKNLTVHLINSFHFIEQDSIFTSFLFKKISTVGAKKKKNAANGEKEKKHVSKLIHASVDVSSEAGRL